MTIIEQEQTAPVISKTRWEALPVAADFKVQHQMDPEADPDDPVTIEAFWDGEPKVSAEIDYFEGVSNIDVIGRPKHWGEDTRSLSEQKREYELGLDGILKEMMGSSGAPIMINSQSGVIAEALMTLRPPAGWKKSTKLISYEGWTDSDSIDLKEVVAEGAVVSLRYETAPAPNPGLGYLAIESARTIADIRAA